MKAPYIALISSILLWISYSFMEKVLNYMEPTSFFFFQEIIYMVVLFFLVFLQKKKSSLWCWTRQEVAMMIWAIIVYWLWEILIWISIQWSNATYVSLIEMSYPLFVILITFLVFRKIRMNKIMIIWSIMIIVWITILITNPI